MPRYHAIARLRTADTQETLLGQIQFLQWTRGGPTTIFGVLQLPLNGPRDQWLALHIHTYGDLSEGCKWVGTHYNPSNQAHGGPMDDVRFKF